MSSRLTMDMLLQFSMAMVAGKLPNSALKRCIPILNKTSKEKRLKPKSRKQLLMHLTKSRKTPLMLQKSDFMLVLHRLLTLVHVPWLLLYMMINCTLQILAIVKVSYFRSKKTASSTTLMSVRRSVRIRNTSKKD